MTPTTKRRSATIWPFRRFVGEERFIDCTSGQLNSSLTVCVGDGSCGAEVSGLQSASDAKLQ